MNWRTLMLLHSLPGWPNHGGRGGPGSGCTSTSFLLGGNAGNLFRQVHRQFAPGESRRSATVARNAAVRLRVGLPVSVRDGVRIPALQGNRVRIQDRSAEITTR